MGRPKNNDYPEHMTVDGDRGGFIVRNPATGKKKRFPREQEAEARTLAGLVGDWLRSIEQKKALDAFRPTIGALCDRWKLESLPHMPWDEYTRNIGVLRINRIKKEMGARTFDDTDSLFLLTWLNQTAEKADPFNKWRAILVLLWRFAVAQKCVATNEAEKVEPRSTSRKIKANRKVRQQLDVAGFTAIYEHAPPWLQLAMDTSLVSLQSRKEICNLKHTDFRSGFVYVIRDKVAGDSNMAFIRIAITPELESIRARAMKLDNTASPFLIHRKADREQRRWIANKPHWTYVNAHYLSQIFAEARDKVERFKALPERQRPTFHEIRGLGARLFEDRGVPRDEIQALMTHSSPDTTTIYLERGPAAIRDADFHRVSAPFNLRELLGV